MAVSLRDRAAARRAKNAQSLEQVAAASGMPADRSAPLVDACAALPPASAARLIAGAVPEPDLAPDALTVFEASRQLERACLGSRGPQVSSFLAKRSTDWDGMGSDDVTALIEWVGRGLDRKTQEEPPDLKGEWQLSASLISSVARLVYKAPDVPNVWDLPPLVEWRSAHPIVTTQDLIDLFTILEQEDHS